VAGYSVIVKPAAERDCDRIDRAVDRERVAERLRELADDPRARGCKKLEGFRNTYRVRQGDYRIIYEIKDDQLVVLVIAIAHRKDVYRRR